MARSDLIISLVRAASRGDQTLYRRTLEALIAEERAKQHNVLADRLAEYLTISSNGPAKALTAPDERVQQLLAEVTPKRTLDDLILPDTVVTAVRELVEEHHRRELLRSYNLEPRHRVLLVGPPGNGKTSLAEALAEALLLPLVVVRYDGIIGSYLGETASRMRRLFDYVHTRQCVLSLDEFDTLGKERGDVHDTGEIKRVVSSLLLQLDEVPSHVVVVTATNHPELLDRAVWRRFQLRLTLPAPSRGQREAWFHRFNERVPLPSGYSARSLAEHLSGASFSELEEFGADVLRRQVLAAPDGNLRDIVRDRLKQWKASARPSSPEDGCSDG
jgi:SpoVK/Ycf46/Vps4 family AAA+-type ATPase